LEVARLDHEFKMKKLDLDHENARLEREHREKMALILQETEKEKLRIEHEKAKLENRAKLK
jgi:hypothetical protein